MAAIIVGNDKGGVGKDVVCEGVYLSAKKNGFTPLLIEVEIEPRLARLYPDAVHVPIGAAYPDSIYSNPDLLFAPLDDAMTRARASDLAIISLGANVTQALQVWSVTSGVRFFGDGTNLTFAIVLTMSRGALPAGLSNLYELGGLYPAARRVAVLNESIADFIEGDQNVVRRLEEACGNGRAIETIKLRRMAAPAWGYLQNMGPLPEIAAKSVADLVNFGLPEGPSVRSLAMVEKWIANDLIAPMTTLLPPLPAAPKKPKARTAP